MDLYHASRQWADRPIDERFWNLTEMQSATKEYADSAVQATIRPELLRVESIGPEMALIGPTGTQATLTHYAFGQLAQRAGAPADYLRKLPGPLAAQCINTTLPDRQKGAENAVVLFHKNGGLLTRCITSDRYARFWHYEVCQQLSRLESNGWRVPPARPTGKIGERTRTATEADCLSRKLPGLSVKVGDTIAPAGLYASDRDMFAFMVDDNHMIQNEADKGTPLARGFFVWNSEVGDKSFGLMTFLYDAVCGNHIVWNVSNVNEVRIRHTGEARDRITRKTEVELRRYAESSAAETEARIASAQKFILGATKDEILERLFSIAAQKRLTALNQGILEDAYVLATRTPRYGNPRSLWAVSQGLTQLSQDSAYTDRRVAIDTAAGRLLEIAF